MVIGILTGVVAFGDWQSEKKACDDAFNACVRSANGDQKSYGQCEEVRNECYRNLDGQK
jgi:hypothetical protein